MNAVSHNATFASWREHVRVSSHAPFVQRRRWLRHLPSLWPWAVNTKNPDAHPFACCPWRALEGVRSTGDSASCTASLGSHVVEDVQTARRLRW